MLVIFGSCQLALSCSYSSQTVKICNYMVSECGMCVFSMQEITVTSNALSTYRVFVK